jgi:carbon storage regulator
MLVLTRQLGQAIVIEGGIRIVVLDAFRNQVRLGITAPRTVSISRSESTPKRPIAEGVPPVELTLS